MKVTQEKKGQSTFHDPTGQTTIITTIRNSPPTANSLRLFPQSSPPPAFTPSASFAEWRWSSLAFWRSFDASSSDRLTFADGRLATRAVEAFTFWLRFANKPLTVSEVMFSVSRVVRAASMSRPLIVWRGRAFVGRLELKIQNNAGRKLCVAYHVYI